MVGLVYISKGRMEEKDEGWKRGLEGGKKRDQGGEGRGNEGRQETGAKQSKYINCHRT